LAQIIPVVPTLQLHSQKKGTKAITMAVPFQKGKRLSILGANV